MPYVRYASPELAALGARIQLARERRGLSKNKLAENVGAARTDLRRAERGQANISTLRLRGIARALEVPPAWLLDNDPEVPPPCL
jgi:transcriptional regulator with XRE-family HTH domain